MGCDFYTYYVLCIEYKKGNEYKVKKEEIEGPRERHYFWGSCLDYDEDFEDKNDYYERYEKFKRDQVENELKNYPRKVIFKDSKWLCLESSKEKYMNLCKKYNIPQNDVISIWKEAGFHFR